MPDSNWLKPAFIIAMASLVCAFLVQAMTDYRAHPSGATSLTVAILVVVFSALFRLLSSVLSLWRSGEPHPAKRLAAAAPHALREQVLIFFAVATVGILLFSTSFLKSMITAVVPFWADPLFARIDKFFGINGQLMASALAPWLPALGFFYGLWHIANLGGILWVIHWRSADRGKFILSYMLTWGTGMVMAYAFSSAGPLFTDRYDLSVAPESVQLPAKFLWANYQAKGALLGGGISAFPSLHVAVATWFALVLAAKGWPKLGLAYVAGIFACSVILGWHYSADGVGGIAIALIANRLAKFLLRPKNLGMGEVQGLRAPLKQ